MLLQQLIERLLRCERRICRVYLALSERVEFPPVMCACWRDMAADENAHRTYLEHTAGLLNFVVSPPDTGALLRSDRPATSKAHRVTYAEEPRTGYESC